MGMVHNIMAEQVAQGRAIILSEGVVVAEEVIVHAAEMQYQGQSHILRIALDSGTITREDMQTAFEEAYFNRFSLHLPEINAVLVTLHTAVIGRRGEVALSALMDPDKRVPDIVAAETGRRNVWFPGGWVETPIISRDALPLSTVFSGPAILEQLDTTIVVEPGNEIEIDLSGNLLINVPPAFKG